MNEVGKLGKEVAHSWHPLTSALGEEKLTPPLGKTVLCLDPSHTTLLSKVPFSSVLTNPRCWPTCPFCSLLGMTYYCPSSIKGSLCTWHRAKAPTPQYGNACL